jgi:hypothetical protein
VVRDLEHLKLLSLFHYIKAAILALMTTLVGGYYVLVGVLFQTLPMPAPPPGATPPPPGTANFMSVMGWFMIVLGAGVLLFGWTMAVLTVLAGRFLARQRRWTFCFVIACIQCAEMPMGTVLGIFTILVLLRPTVKDLFEGKVRIDDPEEEDEEVRPTPPAPSPDSASGDDRIFAPPRDNP